MNAAPVEADQKPDQELGLKLVLTNMSSAVKPDSTVLARADKYV